MVKGKVSADDLAYIEWDAEFRDTAQTVAEDVLGITPAGKVGTTKAQLYRK